MTDLIDRQEAIDAMNARLEDIKLTWRGKVKKGEIAMYLDMRGAIETLPSAQPEIIRCRDCKWYGRADKRRFYRGMDCLQKRIDTIVPDKDYCSRAEKKE